MYVSMMVSVFCSLYNTNKYFKPVPNLVLPYLVLPRPIRSAVWVCNGAVEEKTAIEKDTCTCHLPPNMGDIFGEWTIATSQWFRQAKESPPPLMNWCRHVFSLFSFNFVFLDTTVAVAISKDTNKLPVVCFLLFVAGHQLCYASATADDHQKRWPVPFGEHKDNKWSPTAQRVAPERMFLFLYIKMMIIISFNC